MSFVWLIGFVVTFLASFFFIGKYDLIDFNTADGETIVGGFLSFMFIAALWPVSLPLTGLGVLGYKLYKAGRKNKVK